MGLSEKFCIFHGRRVGVLVKKDLHGNEVKFGEILQCSAIVHELTATSNMGRFLDMKIMKIWTVLAIRYIW